MERWTTTHPRREQSTLRQGQAGAPVSAAAGLEARWASHLDDVRDAQRLRYRVFADEMGARLTPLRGAPDGVDADRFDDVCEHLLIRTAETAEAPSIVVGTYRVLTPAGARLVGGLYSESEFDLGNLADARPHMAELGRSCTAPEWRNGAVILMLWASLAGFMIRNRLTLMVGCASVPMRDGGHAAASLWRALRQTHLAAAHRQVRPLLPLPVDQLDDTLQVEPPPLIKGYLRCGAKVLGAPAWDPDFGVADLPMMLDLKDVPTSYRARFLEA